MTDQDYQTPTKAWNLRLFVAGDSPKSRTALQNLERLCERHLSGRYTLEVVDLVKRPELAKTHQILAIPTLVRELPEPHQTRNRRSIGRKQSAPESRVRRTESN